MIHSWSGPTELQADRSVSGKTRNCLQEINSEAITIRWFSIGRLSLGIVSDGDTRPVCAAPTLSVSCHFMTPNIPASLPVRGKCLPLARSRNSFRDTRRPLLTLLGHHTQPFPMLVLSETMPCPAEGEDADRGHGSWCRRRLFRRADGCGWTRCGVHCARRAS